MHAALAASGPRAGDARDARGADRSRARARARGACRARAVAGGDPRDLRAIARGQRALAAQQRRGARAERASRQRGVDLGAGVGVCALDLRRVDSSSRGATAAHESPLGRAECGRGRALAQDHAPTQSECARGRALWSHARARVGRERSARPGAQRNTGAAAGHSARPRRRFACGARSGVRRALSLPRRRLRGAAGGARRQLLAARALGGARAARGLRSEHATA
jgi:hypothetical protein